MDRHLRKRQGGSRRTRTLWLSAPELPLGAVDNAMEAVHDVPMSPERWGAVAIALSMSVVTMGCSSSSCWDTAPSSDSMREGQTTDVTLRVVNGALGHLIDGELRTLDVDGMYWTSDDQVSLADGEYEATATLKKAGSVAEAGTVLVDLGDYGTFMFTGPVTCE